MRDRVTDARTYCNRPERLEKRRHPDGFVLWDVFAGSRFLGTARQQAVAAPSWFAYDDKGTEVGRFPFRRDAAAALSASSEPVPPGGAA